MTETEEQIILATIRCIEKLGINKTTIRAIGKEAGVNSASISYYFRSKDVLMEKVMEITLDNGFDLSDLGLTECMSPKERLVIILTSLLEGSVRYPNLTKAHFADLFLNGNYNSPAVKRINSFAAEREKEILPFYKEKYKGELQESLIQVISAIFLSGWMLNGFFTVFPDIDFNNEKTRKEYVTNLVEKLLTDRHIPHKE